MPLRHGLQEPELGVEELGVEELGAAAGAEGAGAEGGGAEFEPAGADSVLAAGAFVSAGADSEPDSEVDSLLLAA